MIVAKEIFVKSNLDGETDEAATVHFNEAFDESMLNTIYSMKYDDAEKYCREFLGIKLTRGHYQITESSEV